MIISVLANVLVLFSKTDKAMLEWYLDSYLRNWMVHKAGKGIFDYTKAQKITFRNAASSREKRSSLRYQHSITTARCFLRCFLWSVQKIRSNIR